MMIMMMMMMLIDYEKRKKIINKRFVNNLLAMRLRVVLRDANFFFWSSKNVFRSFFLDVLSHISLLLFGLFTWEHNGYFNRLIFCA